LFGGNNGPARPPAPQTPPLRTFKVWREAKEFRTKDDPVIVEANQIDFTPDGGLVFIMGVPEWMETEEGSGWAMVKRYARGFSSYDEYEEVFTPAPSRFSLQ
jgi:hypothetical protein